MLDNQDIIKELGKLTQLERNTIAINLTMSLLKELQKEVEELKQKIQAYESKKNI